MKNKILKFGILLLILLLSLVTFCGCGDDDSSDDEEENIENISNLKNHTEKQIVENKNEDDLYFKVLNNKLSYVNENNEKTLFSEYMKNFEGNTKTTVKYTLLDLDEDSKKEMVIWVETFDGFYLILNNESGTIYGFEDVLRGMLQIKEDGTYSASGGAQSNAILKCKFNKTERIVETLAEEDYGKYAINGKDVDNSEYSNYLEEFKNKKDVEFVTYIENYDFTSTNSNNNSNEEGQKIYEKAKETTSEIENNLNKLDKTMFNAKFNVYAGTNVKGSQVRTLMSAVKVNNSSDDRKVSLTGDVTKLSDVSIGKTYNVECNYGEDGFINSISITNN